MARHRIEDVRKYIDLHGEASVEDLVELCGGCSKMTIWRYLQQLEEEGAIRRIRGGAISNAHLDIYMASLKDARNWGRQHLEVLMWLAGDFNEILAKIDSDRRRRWRDREALAQLFP
jgi:hypothetical protein